MPVSRSKRSKRKIKMSFANRVANFLGKMNAFQKENSRKAEERGYSYIGVPKPLGKGMYSKKEIQRRTERMLKTAGK